MTELDPGDSISALGLPIDLWDGGFPQPHHIEPDPMVRGIERMPTRVRCRE